MPTRLLTLVVVGVLIPGSAHACNIPVFRYALERWKPDPFEVVVAHGGAPTVEDVANIRGFKQQSARVIAIASEGDDELLHLADHTVFVPHAPELLLPLLEIVPLQLLAYYMTVKKGLDVDRPRNLVKSVTLE